MWVVTDSWQARAGRSAAPGMLRTFVSCSRACADAAAPDAGACTQAAGTGEPSGFKLRLRLDVRRRSARRVVDGQVVEPPPPVCSSHVPKSRPRCNECTGCMAALLAHECKECVSCIANIEQHLVGKSRKRCLARRCLNRGTVAACEENGAAAAFSQDDGEPASAKRSRQQSANEEAEAESGDGGEAVEHYVAVASDFCAKCCV